MVARLGLVALLAGLIVGITGCSTEPGPNDPKMTPAEQKKEQETMYTPEEAERLKPPRG